MDTDVRRKRLLWQASHRGIREMDLLLGGFAGNQIEHMTVEELDELEAIIGLPDQDLLAWIVSEAEIPERHRSGTLLRLVAYRP